MVSAYPTTIPCFHFSPLRVPEEFSPSIRLPLRSKLPLTSSRLVVESSDCRNPAAPCGLSASERLACLVSEFLSLREPIDRVKRLLQYGEILPEFEESARVDSNRVAGCTTQVWLDVGFEDGGGGKRVRFRADSDSEISKGFCSCLIWVLDGAEPEEIMAVRAEDLGPVNMGIVAHSRVNTWHNVLISMQRRTEGLVNGD